MQNNGRFIILFALILLPSVIYSQEMNKTVTDPELNKEILIGHCNQDGLKSGEFGLAYKEYYSLFIPDREIITQLKYLREGVDILIVLGTWCSDSQEQVPGFLKILDKIKFNKKNLTMICVDRNKKAGEVDIADYDIVRVPTFIVYRKGKEIGRIIETPYMTLEKDLLMFLGD